MASGKKAGNTVVKLVSTGEKTYIYYRKRNPKKLTRKLEFRKFNPRSRQHELFKESKR